MNPVKTLSTNLNSTTLNPKTLTDSQLYSLSKKYGKQARLWRQKFIGLLPEVARRKLYLKKGFNSIHEFAAKLAGVSREHVNRVLNIEKKFAKAGTEQLRKILINGEVSSNKLAKIASIASKEQEEELVTAVKILPCRSIETHVRDMKYFQENQQSSENNPDPQNQNGLLKPKGDAKSVHVNKLNNPLKMKLNLSEDTLNQLLELQEKGIDIDELLQQFLHTREQEIQTKKEQIAEEVQEKERGKRQNNDKITRHVPIKVRRILQQEHGTKCSIPQCQKPSKHLHHTVRFGLHRSHDPRLIAPLCKEHHDIAHALDRMYLEKKKVTLSLQ